jgi:hypothetical protein
MENRGRREVARVFRIPISDLLRRRAKMAAAVAAVRLVGPEHYVGEGVSTKSRRRAMRSRRPSMRSIRLDRLAYCGALTGVDRVLTWPESGKTSVRPIA